MAINRRQILGGAVAAGLMAAMPAYGRETVRLSGPAFGTRWSVALPDGTPDGLGEDLAMVLARIDHTMSPFRDDSEISSFNRAGAGTLSASDELALVTREALRIATLTGGAFDPTVGPVVGRYGFGPLHGERVGDYSSVACSAAGISKSLPGLSLDLCGIAKGYAVDAVADWLRLHGHRHYLIDIGGELRVAGQGPDGLPWRLGITDPVAGGTAVRFEALDLALATSGDAINVYEVAGRRYSHIIDPRHGEPVHNTVASVSVAHASAMTADGLATAMMVLGADRGLELAETLDLPVLFLLRNEAGSLTLSASSAFRALRAS